MHFEGTCKIDLTTGIVSCQEFSIWPVTPIGFVKSSQMMVGGTGPKDILYFDEVSDRSPT
jgi:hypothetical protein